MSDNPSRQSKSTISSKSSSGSDGATSPSSDNSPKNKLAAVQSGIKGSFQLDEKDKKIIGDKKWVHWSLLFIPFGILASIVILLWAFHYSGFRIETGKSQDNISEVQDVRVPEVIPLTEEEKLEPTAPPISSEERSGLLNDYFSNISENYISSYLDDLPDDAVNLYIVYDGTEDNVKKKVAAEDFFILLSQPLRANPQEGYGDFIIDVQIDLEKAIGEPLFD